MTNAVISTNQTDNIGDTLTAGKTAHKRPLIRWAFCETKKSKSMIGNQKDNERTVGAGTKLDPAMAEVLNLCCDVLQVDTYHLFQWFAYTIIRAAAPWHELDPRIQKLLAMMESDAGWQHAFNLANPSKLKVSQIIMILEQEGRKGFGAVMIDKPWMEEEPHITENVDDILERVTEVTMHGIYRRLRLVGDKMHCDSLSDILLTMIDAQTMLDLDEGFRAELPGMGEYADNGRIVAYGKRTKQTKRKTPDDINKQMHITFDDNDREVSNYEAKDWEGSQRQTEPEPPEDLEKELGFRPIGGEW